VEERRGQGEEPAGAVRQAIVPGQVADQLAQLARQERGQQRHEERSRGVAAQGVGRQDQYREAERVHRVDLAALAAHAVMRLQGPRVERAVSALGVVPREGHVVVAPEAVSHHEVMGLVAFGPHLLLHPRRGPRVEQHHDRQECRARQARRAAGQGKRHPREQERQQRVARERPEAGDGKTAENGQDDRAQARQGGPAPRP
jgi:hypothetical protein